MKKFYLPIFFSILLLLLPGCTSTKKLEGNWETIVLLKDGEYQDVVDSNINFVLKDKKFKINGCAGVNLYYAYVKTKGKSFEASGMANTGFSGIASEMKFEDMFFEALMHADSYKIEEDILYIYNLSSNMELQLKQK